MKKINLFEYKEINNKDKEENITKKASKTIKMNSENKKVEKKISLNKNNFLHNYDNCDNIINENEEINDKNQNIFPNLKSTSKLNFEQIKQKFRQLDNNYDENNITILNNIDRLTSILSSIIIAQNEQATIEKENNKKDILFNDNDNKINEGINPLIIDANNDQYINYLLSLNDSFKKKINKAIKFDEIDNFFTNFVIEQIENFMTNLKKIK